MNGYFVDWVSAVLTYEQLNFLPEMGILWSDVSFLFYSLFGLTDDKRTKPRNGYTHAYRSESTGMTIQFAEGRPDMGVNIVATGKTLEMMDWRFVVKRLNVWNARFTRVDLSVDIHSELFDIDELFLEMSWGLCITKARRYSRVQSETGTTFYVGGRTSEKFLRVYDKGGEQGGEQKKWVRVELECKGVAAAFVSELLVKENSDLARQIILSYFDAPGHFGWTHFMYSTESIIKIPSEKKAPNTEAWLFGLVTDCILQMEFFNPGFVAKFVDHLVSQIHA